MFWLDGGLANPPPPPPAGVDGAYCPVAEEYASTCPFVGAADPTGTLCISVAFALDPHDPHVPFPSKQFNPEAAPVPNSLVGTNPLTKSAFTAILESTYCLSAACSGAVGVPLSA